MKKPILLGVSVILVIGVVIGLVGVNHNKSSQEEEDKKALSTATKPVASVCSQADHKKACVDSLNSVGKNPAATPRDFLHAALDVTIDAVGSAMENSASLKGKANDPLNKMAVDDCKELLGYANDELQAAFTSVGDSDLHTVNDRTIELKNWLSAVISYQQTCIDGFTQPDLQTSINQQMLNASQLTDNALAIVSTLSEIYSSFNIQLNSSSITQRRLLETEESSEEGEYPAWVSSGDRKLLGHSQMGHGPPPSAVVAQDGSGNFKKIQDALDAYPKDLKGRYVIYVKAGIYNEYITVQKDQVNVFMYGDGPRKTIVTGRKCNRDGVSTFQTASFSAIGKGFIAKSMGFQNTAGPEGHQAVALRSQSDMSVFYNCRMDGYQDTLYAQTNRQFYRNCVISGTVDFIFGDSTTVIQNCLIIVRKPMDNQQNTVTAQGRTNERETTGIVIQNCRIVPEQKLEADRFKIPTFLGRPWKTYCRTVIMECTLADFIQPLGWMPWAGNFALDTLYYAEYANRGPGANTDKRVDWKGYKVIRDVNEARQFTVGPFIQGDQWIKYTGAPHFLGFVHS